MLITQLHLCLPAAPGSGNGNGIGSGTTPPLPHSCHLCPII